MITKKDYIEYLISTPVNYTCTNLADHLDEVSHDAVTDYLHREKLTARHLWEQVHLLLNDSPDASLSADDAQDANAIRWQVEQLHRELKQLTGIEKCQCRKQRPQRNHIACCYQAWLAIKVKADEVGKTLYALVDDLLYEFLRAELRDPRIPALEAA